MRLLKKVTQQIFVHPSLLLLFLDPGSEIRVNIPDPQHWLKKKDLDPGPH
jgi:hypothetical protein